MSRHQYLEAVRDFQDARQKAGMQKLISRLTGKSLHLLAYDEVRQQLKGYGKTEKGLKEIPLESIVGSVGRYQDFTRSFLPTSDSDKSRWAGVKVAQVTKGLPPITVYQIGDAYFVMDGNHRVSVARQLGNKVIEAYVTEVSTKVPLSPDDEPDDIILKAEYVDFLEQTHLDELRPEVDFSLTLPGKYPLLLEHIEVHRYYMGVERKRDVGYPEAVVHWCDEVYRAVVQMIRESGLIRDFPERTEADMYVWLAEHRAEIEESLGWEVPTATAVSDLAAQIGSYKPQTLWGRALQAVLPGGIEPGSSVGQWRRERTNPVGEQHLIRLLMVPISGSEMGWHALDQAIRVAKMEDSIIRGLYTVADPSKQHGIMVQAIRAEFERRCLQGGVDGALIVEVGSLEKQVSRRSRWADALVLQPFAPPEESEAWIDPLMRSMIRSAAGPILVVLDQPSPMKKGLLAYDGTLISDEALFTAAYLSSRWRIPFNVVTVGDEEEKAANILQKAARYLASLGVEAEARAIAGDVGDGILTAAAEGACDFIVMGSPSLNPMLELVVDSTVQTLLERSTTPLVLCR